MNLIKDKADCSGCRTCELVCPKSAITMKEDECGFIYPEINAKKCIDCGLCEKKCAFQSGYKKRKEFEPFYGYAARHKNHGVLMKSRSGGAFTAVSDLVLENGGVVFGAGFYEKKTVFDKVFSSKEKNIIFKFLKNNKEEESNCFAKIVHKKAETKEERDEFRGSKYVQSDLGDTFIQVKQMLEDGRQVLFTGTGCQVGALYMFLGKEYDNLITMDIVCHGVPTPKLWHDFLDMREREENSRVTQVNFRDKVKFGWKAHRETVWVDGKEISSRLYTKIFYMDTALRPSCFKCIYANKNRPGDFTIADFWGHERAVPGFAEDDKGVSLVIVNTNHAKKIWEEASKSMDVIDCTGYPFRHTNMKRPTKKPDNYEEFWKDYLENGFDFVMEKYCNYKVVTYSQKLQQEIEKEERKKRKEKKRRNKKRKNKIQNIKQRVKNKIKKVIGYE